MKRYQDNHVVVTLSDEGLRRAYGDNDLLRACDINTRLIYAIGLPICIAICLLVAHAAVVVD